jgi:hypothetical protein
MIVAFFRRVWRWVTGRLRLKPRRFLLTYVESDELPEVIPARTLVIAREDGDLWSAGMICPCGCNRRIELMLLPGVKPRWDLRVGSGGRPTLSPSVWVIGGCRAHFWLRDGEVHWCRD